MTQQTPTIHEQLAGVKRVLKMCYDFYHALDYSHYHTELDEIEGAEMALDSIIQQVASRDQFMQAMKEKLEEHAHYNACQKPFHPSEATHDNT